MHLVSGTDSIVGPGIRYRADYKYPLHCRTITEIDRAHGNSTTLSHLSEGLTLKTEGRAVFSTGLEAFHNSPGAETAGYLGSHLETSRNGTATVSQANDGSYSLGSGITNQLFYFGGFNDTTQKELYFRNVSAVGQAILSDSKRLVGAPYTGSHLGARESGEGHEDTSVLAQDPVSLVGIGEPTTFTGRPRFRGPVPIVHSLPTDYSFLDD